jgi:hypothetical protein
MADDKFGVKAAVAAERERCAKIAEAREDDPFKLFGEVATLIRSGNPMTTVKPVPLLCVIGWHSWTCGREPIKLGGPVYRCRHCAATKGRYEAG